MALGDALRGKGVDVNTLFFPPDHRPPLDREYQLALQSEAGRTAFDRAVAFLAMHANKD